MTMQTINLLAASLIQFGILFQTLGTDAQKYISSYINLSCGQTSKGLRLEHSNLCFWIRSLTFIGALPLSTLNVWNNILYGDPKCTESQCGWNKIDIKFCRVLSAILRSFLANLSLSEYQWDYCLSMMIL